MTSVEHYGIHTVINKTNFKENVIIKECSDVGRSLVAKRPLSPGDVVLVEEPLIKYDLRPKCRSSRSPYYSKKIWNYIVSIIENEERKEEQYSSDDDSSGEYDDTEDNDSQDEDKDTTEYDSDFCPGVPAAIMAYLDIHPPVKSFSRLRRRRTYNENDFDFFYYPNTDVEAGWFDHRTIKLIHNVTQKVVDTISLFAHVDPFDLRGFVLKIYSNAHTVALPRSRITATHTKRKFRREFYKAKFGDNVTYWGNEDSTNASTTPMIALLRWGSKFAHSCSPNMFLRFQPEQNAMVFTVIRPLKEGEVLTFSYLPEDDSTLGGLICGTTMDRRAKLQKFKFFDCMCERCLDWDWSRGLTCEKCQEPRKYYHGQTNDWVCFSCGSKTNREESQPTTNSFIDNGREQNVQRMVMGFFARLNGSRPVSRSMLSMLEPYLLNLLSPPTEKKGEVPVPKHHWSYSVIHCLLATYHLKLFPQSFGKGLASQMGLLTKGLEEALVYLEFLDESIFSPRDHHPEATSPGNPIAAFFAGWRMLSTVIDFIMESTENKYANVTYEVEDLSDISDAEEFPKKINKAPQNVKPVLINMDEDWIKPVKTMSYIISNKWIPLIEKVFNSQQQLEVIDDMIRRMKCFTERVELTSNSSALK
ncbi:hypothetical protein BDF20DRAFT_818884 [Mycotypha africana]|uniref:uncharacterized protein n=1 Tax=Mycotypha africana TaxID=64632 RepID=UPI002301CBA6|nr:uncharacterized protein BDF20DRAFT_818884 [Mycotypha africana]KAI8979683.1 hypothetical protein BDF20DRAFT_818884 [Mycotypha africana]